MERKIEIIDVSNMTLKEAQAALNEVRVKMGKPPLKFNTYNLLFFGITLMMIMPQILSIIALLKN